MKLLLLFPAIFCLSLLSFGQSPGDTIVVQAFDYSMTTGSGTGLPRSMVVPFPNNPGISYEKIIMQYNMRCRDGNVNNTGGNFIACGEWDYSCNSYIHDSTRVDSVANTTPSHSISGFSGSIYDYSQAPVYDYYRHIQQSVAVDSIIAETASAIGAGSLVLADVLPNSKRNAKSQYLFTAAELTAAGAVAGNLDALSLNVTNAGGQADFFRIKLKESTKTVLDDSDPDLDGFTEVFYQNTAFVNGPNRLQFYTPFAWDGTSNVIVELSFTNPNNTVGIEIEGSNAGAIMGLHSAGDRYFNFNGNNYIESDNYKGIGGNTSRTVEAWINTSVNNNEIVGWGTNNTTEKWTFRVNGNGTIRAEVSGGFKFGTTLVNDGEWHHVAVVFSGNNITSAQLYVDGNLESTGGSQAQTVNTNAVSGINMRITRGVNNSYFVGVIDEVRVWSEALTINELRNWMFRSVDNSHPRYSNLESYFQMNEGTGSLLSESSPNARNASVMRGEVWTMPKGVDLFKEFNASTERPNVTFFQGNYNLTIMNDTVVDSIVRPFNTVEAYQISSNSGTIMTDDIIVSSTNQYWEADYQYYFDENGVKIDSVIVPIDGTINITALDYWQRFPMRFEIISFVTPYGIGLDMGINGKTWHIDLTDFTPVLKGDKLMTMERGGQWQEDFDIKFLFIVGTPPRDVLDIQEVWRNDMKGYSSILSDQSFEPRDLVMNPAASSYKIRTAISGHGQQGEFIPRQHYVNLNGGGNEFQWQAWKECAENPVYPQGGTWIYDRAGWCPGMPTDVQESDITPFVTPGQSHTIDYGLTTASGTSNYLVSNQLVTYDAINHALDAAVVDVQAPTDYVEYERFNSVCANPSVMIQNTGSTTLTSLVIEYWVNNGNVESYTWTGNLDFLEKEVVELPSPASLWASSAVLNNSFNVKIKDPNGSADGYSFNNTYRSAFDFTDILPSDFYLQFRTNSAASESSYELLDDAGNVLFSKSNMANNTTYKDTFSLERGCYTLKVSDSDDDGISFFANNDGNGSISIWEVGAFAIKTFNPNYGDGIIYHFSVDAPLSFEDLHDKEIIDLFPNPAKNSFTLEAGNIGEATIEVYNGVGQIVNLPSNRNMNRVTFNSEGLPAGIYLITINYKDKVQTKKLIIE